MATNGTLIEIEDLTKVFYTDEVETHALSGIHLTIERGEYVAMSGPSGCGKSTLLSILGLLDTPTGGRYLLNGNPVENLSFGDRSRIRNQEIGFIFQSCAAASRRGCECSMRAAVPVETSITFWRRGMKSSVRTRIRKPSKPPAVLPHISRRISPVTTFERSRWSGCPFRITSPTWSSAAPYFTSRATTINSTPCYAARGVS